MIIMMRDTTIQNLWKGTYCFVKLLSIKIKIGIYITSYDAREGTDIEKNKDRYIYLIYLSSCTYIYDILLALKEVLEVTGCFRPLSLN